MKWVFDITRESEERLRVKRWTFQAAFSVHNEHPSLKLILIGYDDGVRDTPRKRNLKFTDRRRWAFRNIRSPGEDRAWNRVETWNDMTGCYDITDTRSSRPCEAPPLPDDVRDEAMLRCANGIELIIPDPVAF